MRIWIARIVTWLTAFLILILAGIFAWLQN